MPTQILDHITQNMGMYFGFRTNNLNGLDERNLIIFLPHHLSHFKLLANKIPHALVVGGRKRRDRCGRVGSGGGEQSQRAAGGGAQEYYFTYHWVRRLG